MLPNGRPTAHLTGFADTGLAAERVELLLVLGSHTRIQELRWSLSAGDASRILATETLQALVVTLRDVLLHGDAVRVDGLQLFANCACECLRASCWEILWATPQADCIVRFVLAP